MAAVGGRVPMQQSHDFDCSGQEPRLLLLKDSSSSPDSASFWLRGSGKC